MAKRSLIKDISLFSLLLAIGFSGSFIIFQNFDYEWNWADIGPYLFTLDDGLQIGILTRGLFTTISISILSIFLGGFLGLILALTSLSSQRYLRWMSRILIEIIRGTPLLVQLFIVYFVFGTVLGIDSGFICGLISFSLFSACYISEILRSGIEAIPQGQKDAGHVLGMNSFQILFYIIMPQALKISLPSLTGTFISLIKDSSLLSILAVMDLTKAAREVVSNTFASFETWILVACIYLLMTYPLSYLARSLEKNLDKN